MDSNGFGIARRVGELEIGELEIHTHELFAFYRGMENEDSAAEREEFEWIRQRSSEFEWIRHRARLPPRRQGANSNGFGSAPACICSRCSVGG